MTGPELVAKWAARLAEWRELGVSVDGARVAAEIVTDLRALEADDVVDLHEAAAIGGYSSDHLSRLLSSGKLANAGRKHAPRIRRSDIPRKPGHQAPLPDPADGGHFTARRRIVAAAIAPRRG